MSENQTFKQPESKSTYQRPAVEDLGKWQVVTLQYSVPFNGMSDTDIEAYNGLNDFNPDL